MSSLSLYDKLLGCFASHEDPAEVDPAFPLASFEVNEKGEHISQEALLRNSIMENIKLIMQSRRGGVPHLPSFGLPDFKRIYLEHGIEIPVRHRICELIKETIKDFEPRIEDLEIVPTDFNVENLRLTVEIEVTLHGGSGKEVFITEFSSEGLLRVSNKDDSDINTEEGDYT